MEFREERGIAYCGMACVLCCSEGYENCQGCLADYNPKADDPAVLQCAGEKGVDGCYACGAYPCGKENNDCFVKQCARKHGVEGCFACPEYPCYWKAWQPWDKWNQLKNKRNRAFLRYAHEFGKQALIDRLRVNHENGIVYPKDYDAPEKEFEIYLLLRYGRDEAARNQTPEITVKPLSPALTEDFFEFFNLRAFTDSPPWGGCYCQFPQMSKEDAVKARETPEAFGEGGIIREQHRTGAIRGYLAYADGLPIGWCNANDRANLPIEPAGGPSHYAPAERKEKAVLCFEIAPEYRGKGVARALLRRVIDDARAEGCTAIEAYPDQSRKRDNYDYHGPVRLYEKAGFVVVEKKGKPFHKKRALTMRLELE